jgi:drug/metabolite transporter (DMT)-like permease
MLLVSTQRQGRLFVALAAAAWSTAGILQRELTLDLPTQLAGRAVFAALGIGLYVALVERGGFRAIGRGGLLVALLLSISSGSFIASLNHASVANVLFMQALAPVLAAVLGLLLGEPVSKRTWLAMAVAIGGVALMVGGPGHPSALGLGLSFVMTLSFAATLVITRHLREVSMAPATCLSQLIVLVCAAPFAHASEIGSQDLVLLVSLGIGQIGLGFVLLTIGARLIPAAEVALIALLEAVLGPIWVWAFLGENVSAATFVGGAVVLAAVGIQVRGGEVAAPQRA